MLSDRDTFNKNKQKKQRGRLGEEAAEAYLTKRGYKLLSRNFHSLFGEIDLIFQKEQTIVFVEVKTRFDTTFGTPFESVTKLKLQKIVKTAYYFLQLNPKLPRGMRVDAIGVIMNSEGKVVKITHLVNVTT